MSTNIAVLGFEHGHVNAYCKQWASRPELGINVVAGWDHDAELLAKAVKQHDLEPIADFDALLARDDISGVVIAAETSLHADLVEAAASAGKTIALQKPMSLTLPEADRIVAAVAAANERRVGNADANASAGGAFTMCWQMRVDPQNLKIKELLESGEFGKVFSVRRRHGLPMCLRDAFADSWHVAPDKNRDIWADDAAHPIDFIHWLLGVPATVTAEIESLHNPRMPMDTGVAVYRYEGGPLVVVNCAFANLASENTVEVVCEKGSIIQNYGDVPSCSAPKPDNARGLKWIHAGDKEWRVADIASPKSHGERIAHLAEPLAGFFQGKRAPIATAEEGRTSLRMLLATYVASREGRRVSLDDEAIGDV